MYPARLSKQQQCSTFVRDWTVFAAEELHLTTARLVPEPNTAAALRLSGSRPLVQTLPGGARNKPTLVSRYKAHPRGIPQSQPRKRLIVFIYLFRQASIFTSQRSDRSNRSRNEFPPWASFAAPPGLLSLSHLQQCFSSRPACDCVLTRAIQG